MKKNIFSLLLPMIIYIVLSNYVEPQNELLLITLILSTIIFWAISLIPDYQTSLIFLFSSLFFSLSSKEIIFSGFSSSAFWLVISGMLIATAIKNVDLSLRFTNLFKKLQSPSYIKILIVVSFFALLFAFIMPSGTARVVLLVPIGIIIAKSYGFSETSKGYIGILLTIILSTTIPAFTILPANAPNMILSGLVHQIFNYEIYYSHYLLANFLVLGLLKNIIMVGIIFYFFKDTPNQITTISKNQQITKDEKIVMLTIAIMLLFWVSDFLHGVSPTIIAIIGILFLANPVINIIKTQDINSVNFSSLIFLAAIISLGNIVSNNQYINDIFTQFLGQIDFSNESFINYMVLNILMGTSGILLTQPTIPVLFTPIIDQLSVVTQFTNIELLMMQVASFSTVLFPYQMPPLVVGLALAKVNPINMIKVLSILTIVTIILLYPLQFIWMNFLEGI